MFRTHDSDLIGIPGMFGESLANWHSVSRVLRSHWYHLAVEITEGGRTTEISHLIEGEYRLQQMLVCQSAEEVIVDVKVVTPSWMNHSDGWGMDRVVKVTVGNDEGGCAVCLIEVDGGMQFHSSHRPGFQIESLTNLRPIFLDTMIRSA